jgi:7,8-dihydropterin-6-yl-methyl-4-(beta-D-ribofuranosyl)aminobenzene 5'-phosphate synthase
MQKIMEFRLTVLCENSVGKISGSLGEHGFALLVESVGSGPLLFDTGQGATLLHNAARMNKDLSQVSTVVLSHGHYDHTGGLLPLLNHAGPKNVFAHPDLFIYRCRKKDDGGLIDIGVPYSREEFEAAGAVFDLSADFRNISPGICITGVVPRKNSFETGDQGLFADRQTMVVDRAPDDQALVLDTKKGLVVVLGCCHAGIINTLDYIEAKTGKDNFYAVIGGTHLGFCSAVQLDHTVKELKKRRIGRLAVSHCTGFQASARLFREMPKQFALATVGYTLEV